MCQSGPDSPRRAVAAFLAQLIGGRLARRRLDAARGAAAAIHAAYRGTDIVPSRGTLVDISI